MLIIYTLNISKGSKTAGTNFCPLCAKNVDEKEYRNHLTKCYKVGKEGTLLRLPEEGATMNFKNFKNKLEGPFIVYADMESTLVKTTHDKNIHEHVPNSCCFYFVCTYDDTQNVLWHDVSINCVENMIKELNKLSFKCKNIMKHNEEMKMDIKDIMKAKYQTSCHICDKAFNADDVKCKDHDHRTGEFRGMAHQKCNINYYNNFLLTYSVP